VSLSGALNSAVTGLNSQSSALAMIATNLANASTTGYKSVTASFSTMLNGGNSSLGAVGGVKVAGLTNVGAQGLAMPSTVTTNMAISGSGFFVVAPGPNSNQLNYTRNGEFDVDDNGYLVNGGQYLQGWATDASGNIVGGANAGTLEAIDVNKYTTIAGATSKAALKATLPLNATIGDGAAVPPVIADTFTSSMEVFDSMGTAATVTITWEKTGGNTWQASFSDAKLSSDPTKTVGTIANGPVEVTFNSDGTFNTVDFDTATAAIDTGTLNIAWSTGATTPAAVALDFTAMTQYDQDSDEMTVELETVQDGVPYGTLSKIAIGEGGAVNALYSNGMVRTLYKVPVATFANVNGLTASSGGIYSESAQSGTSTLRMAGQNGAGDILGATLEMSTTDTNKEFASMMTAQQAYSGNAQVMSAANSMFDTLIGAVR
jgi:flagellar hook protein FlgE